MCCSVEVPSFAHWQIWGSVSCLENQHAATVSDQNELQGAVANTVTKKKVDVYGEYVMSDTTV